MAWEPDYVTVAELAGFLRIDDNVDDTELGIAVTAASRAVDEHCGRVRRRQFGKVAVAEKRFYTAEWSASRCRWVIIIDDLQDVTGLLIEIDTEPVTLFVLEPVNAAVEGRPFTRLVIDEDSTVTPSGEGNEIEITALWGWNTVPVPVRQATLLQASRFFNRRFSPYGIAGSPDTGSELRLLARVDPDVAVALRRFVRNRVGVG